MYLLIKVYNATHETALPQIKAETDQTSRSNYQFTENTSDGRTY